MTESPADAYPYLEEALPGFHRGWVLVKEDAFGFSS